MSWKRGQADNPALCCQRLHQAVSLPFRLWERVIMTEPGFPHLSPLIIPLQMLSS